MTNNTTIYWFEQNIPKKISLKKWNFHLKVFQVHKEQWNVNNNKAEMMTSGRCYNRNITPCDVALRMSSANELLIGKSNLLENFIRCGSQKACERSQGNYNSVSNKLNWQRNRCNWMNFKLFRNKSLGNWWLSVNRSTDYYVSVRMKIDLNRKRYT